jgi:hypothetical protein
MKSTRCFGSSIASHMCHNVYRISQAIRVITLLRQPIGTELLATCCFQCSLKQRVAFRRPKATRWFHLKFKNVPKPANQSVFLNLNESNALLWKFNALLWRKQHVVKSCFPIGYLSNALLWPKQCVVAIRHDPNGLRYTLWPLAILSTFWHQTFPSCLFRTLLHGGQGRSPCLKPPLTVSSGNEILHNFLLIMLMGIPHYKYLLYSFNNTQRKQFM